MELPASLRINAWIGSDALPESKIAPHAARWGLRRWASKADRTLAAGEPPDLRNWRDPEVGWGLVLPERTDLSEADRARAVDAPEPIRELLAARESAPVFRYTGRLDTLRRYYVNGSAQDIALLRASERVVGRGRLPHYMLIYGTPADIPWRLQYVLNQPCLTGRLHLTGEALENYVAALLGQWADAGCHRERPLVWTVDHGHPDITWLMRRALAEPVHAKLVADAETSAGALLVGGDQATGAALAHGLADAKPALVVTTSHGLTSPLDDAAALGARLGLLVDRDHAAIGPETLLAAWQPDGAIWYCHACCSAGSDGETGYAGLVEEGSSVDRILRAVAAAGATVAPLPTALLGAKQPLRAFIGQVEPTFDWTLRSPETGQVLSSPFVGALYDRMYRAKPEPVGLAFQESFRVVGELLSQWEKKLDDVDAAVPGAEILATRLKLTARDRESMVILGDPTVSLPAARV